MPVGKKRVERQKTADRAVGTDADAELTQLFLIAVENAQRQTEVGDAVAHHAADLVHALEDCHVVALLRELDGDGDAGRTRADDGDGLPRRRRTLQGDAVEVGIRNVVLDAGDLDGGSFAQLDAVALALLLMVADERADDAQGIVLEEHSARLVDAAFEKEADHLGDVRLHRTALDAAQGLFALEAAPRLVNDMDCHEDHLSFVELKYTPPFSLLQRGDIVCYYYHIFFRKDKPSPIGCMCGVLPRARRFVGEAEPLQKSHVLGNGCARGREHVARDGGRCAVEEGGRAVVLDELASRAEADVCRRVDEAEESDGA